MPRSSTRFTTPHASLYLKKLCKHFRHKVEAQWDDEEGIAHFPMGIGRFRADAEKLLIDCEAANVDALETVQWIIEDHLQRFARQESPVLQWQTPSAY